MKFLTLLAIALTANLASAFDGLETYRCAGPNLSDRYEIKLFTETSSAKPVVRGEFAIVKLVHPQVAAKHASYVLPAGGFTLLETPGREEMSYLITDNVNKLRFSNCTAVEFEALTKSSP